ncbi:hypothetical protein GO308_00660 [Sphingomonas sp. SFZ2018-12]|uniref:hypothetical protein n=1 Tax=Sphingomonas sp. SFZ2018-12 TaxID=2683197 RepID=UPI001F104A15|nr:hypothetical protein [Sphingomonas sp. SFZ2018-12]MCH4891617.1 hypothetical protein [Sphingomonas sp. SFZ2018-12]
MAAFARRAGPECFDIPDVPQLVRDHARLLRARHAHTARLHFGKRFLNQWLACLGGHVSGLRLDRASHRRFDLEVESLWRQIRQYRRESGGLQRRKGLPAHIAVGRLDDGITRGRTVEARAEAANASFCIGEQVLCPRRIIRDRHAIG